MRRLQPGGAEIGRPEVPIMEAGIKPGLAYGATDDIGYYITENQVGIHDLQATILNQLGLDPYRFSVPYQGLNNRLIGPTDEGQVLKSILA